MTVYCTQCGFTSCEWGNTCLGCVQDHARRHVAWEQAQFMADDPYKSSTYPMVPYEKRQPPFDRGPHCPCCEMRINVSQHVCRSTEKSEDWLDVLRRLP